MAAEERATRKGGFHQDFLAQRQVHGFWKRDTHAGLREVQHLHLPGLVEDLERAYQGSLIWGGHAHVPPAFDLDAPGGPGHPEDRWEKGISLGGHQGRDDGAVEGQHLVAKDDGQSHYGPFLWHLIPAFGPRQVNGHARLNAAKVQVSQHPVRAIGPQADRGSQLLGLPQNGFQFFMARENRVAHFEPQFHQVNSQIP